MVGATDSISAPATPQQTSTRSARLTEEKTTIAEQIAWLKGATHGFQTSLDSFERVERKVQTLAQAKTRIQGLLEVVKMYEDIRPRPEMKS